MNSDRHLKGLGGWLVFVAIGIIISPLQIIFQVFPMYIQMVSNGTMTALITSGTDSFNPILFSLLIGEMTINGALIIAWIFLAFLFFSKKMLFPKLHITVLVFSLAFLVLDSLVLKILFPSIPVFGPDMLNAIGRNLLVVVIWVPYMLRSKRVKATFINHMSNQKLQPTVKTPVESGNVQGTAAEL